MALAFGSAFRLGVFCSVSILIAACGDKEEAAQPITSQQTTKQLEQAEAKALEAERRLREAEKERIADAEARQILEHQHKVALEEGKSSERITWILGVLVVIALLVGIAIGSSSRKDANSSKQ